MHSYFIKLLVFISCKSIHITSVVAKEKLSDEIRFTIIADCIVTTIIVATLGMVIGKLAIIVI